MRAIKEYILELPLAGRPSGSRHLHLPNPGRSEHEQAQTRARDGDPLDQICAVLIDSDTRTSFDEACNPPGGALRWHHVVPSDPAQGHGVSTWALANECRAVATVSDDQTHPIVNGGKPSANSWSVSLLVLPVSGHGARPTFSSWQILNAARIVRQCWRRYPNLRYVADAALFHANNGDSSLSTFPFDKLFALILDPATDASGREERDLVRQASQPRQTGR